jgi:hypothetical protein
MVAMNVWPTDASDGSVTSEARWRKMARHWTATGVLKGVGQEMAPTLAYPNLTVKDGACWVDGHFCELLGTQVLTVTANGLAVVRFDPAANTADLLYRDAVSVPAQSPTGTWELPIAKITGSVLADQRAMVSAGGPAVLRAVGTGSVGTLTATPVDVPGLILTVTTLASHWYRIVGRVSLVATGAVGTLEARLMEDGAAIDFADATVAASSQRQMQNLVLRQPTAGVHVYKVMALTDASGGQIPNTLAQNNLTIEDLGV